MIRLARPDLCSSQTWRIWFARKKPCSASKRGSSKLSAQYVPTSLTDRPKQGFGIPVDRWVRGPLRDWAESLLDPRLLAEQGFFRANHIRQVWEEHKSGRANRITQLWPILMFQAWHREGAGQSQIPTVSLRRAA